MNREIEMDEIKWFSIRDSNKRCRLLADGVAIIGNCDSART